MTREEAIEYLEIERTDYDMAVVYNDSPIREALNMAIEALKEPEPITLTYDEKCIFLAAISRERRRCQEIDAEADTINPLVPIVDSIIRKVRAVLWGEKNE